ncbi:MAG: hypothetical protein AB9866_13205 [Syntrophobacteraceae bacterium]
MNLGKIVMTLLLAGVVAAPQLVANMDNQGKGQTARPLVSNMDTREKAPAFSSPEVKMHENGDRVSHYPPYYHPERSGNR